MLSIKDEIKLINIDPGSEHMDPLILLTILFFTQKPTRLYVSLCLAHPKLITEESLSNSPCEFESKKKLCQHLLSLPLCESEQKCKVIDGSML